ncbi:MAG: branched-chain amino acid ABC transporter permease [Rhodobiaceae bacterium]|nr:branched-chain amino acid ABC transporter permease [Rhodobiaceae bacterium]
MEHFSMMALWGQLVVGLINGSFYALLSLGLAIIFGLLKVANFAHGALFMLGAFSALLMHRYLGVNYWFALVLAPLVVAAFGVVFERLALRRLYHLHHLYGMLLTFGLALVVQGVVLDRFGASGASYPPPDLLRGGLDLGFMFVPVYRLWVIVAAIVVCACTWIVIEKTKLGAYLRAATENPELLKTFSVNVPLLLTATYAAGVGLAALAGVMAAPIYQVSPMMGADIIIVVFAVVVVGGMGSISGAIFTGFGLGLLEGVAKVVYPEAANSVIFAMMALVLLFRPAGLFGKET